MRTLLTLIVVFLIILAAYSMRQAQFGGGVSILGFVGFVLFALLFSQLDSKK